MKSIKEFFSYVLLIGFVSFIYMGIKGFLGLFMSDDLSRIGLSLLLTYIAYDTIRIKTLLGIKR